MDKNCDKESLKREEDRFDDNLNEKLDAGVSRRRALHYYMRIAHVVSSSSLLLSTVLINDPYALGKSGKHFQRLKTYAFYGWITYIVIYLSFSFWNAFCRRRKGLRDCDWWLATLEMVIQALMMGILTPFFIMITKDYVIPMFSMSVIEMPRALIRTSIWILICIKILLCLASISILRQCDNVRDFYWNQQQEKANINSKCATIKTKESIKSIIVAQNVNLWIMRFTIIALSLFVHYVTPRWAKNLLDKMEITIYCALTLLLYTGFMKTILRYFWDKYIEAMCYTEIIISFISATLNVLLFVNFTNKVYEQIVSLRFVPYVDIWCILAFWILTLVLTTICLTFASKLNQYRILENAFAKEEVSKNDKPTDLNEKIYTIYKI